jgi:hypothetical protein
MESLTREYVPYLNVLPINTQRNTKNTIHLQKKRVKKEECKI